MDYRIPRAFSPDDYQTLHQCAFHSGAVDFSPSSLSYNTSRDNAGENGPALSLQTYWPGHIPNIFINHHNNNASPPAADHVAYDGVDPDSSVGYPPRDGGCTYRQTRMKRRRIATPSQRRAANIRERRRMLNLNSSFDALRQKVPVFAYEKRLSRIETLRLAITYIGFLGELIEGKNPDEIQLNLFWRRCEKKELKPDESESETNEEESKTAEKLVIEN